MNSDLPLFCPLCPKVLMSDSENKVSGKVSVPTDKPMYTTSSLFSVFRVWGALTRFVSFCVIRTVLEHRVESYKKK